MEKGIVFAVDNSDGSASIDQEMERGFLDLELCLLSLLLSGVDLCFVSGVEAHDELLLFLKATVDGVLL